MILIALLAAPLALTSVEFCSAAPEPPATEPPEWHWRMVDGKKCYFRADKLLPREDLVWSYDAKQLDLDEGATVKGRRHYTPQELKAITAIERQMREDDQAPPKRKKIRRRRRRDNDDDASSIRAGSRLPREAEFRRPGFQRGFQANWPLLVSDDAPVRSARLSAISAAHARRAAWPWIRSIRRYPGAAKRSAKVRS